MATDIEMRDLVIEAKSIFARVVQWYAFSNDGSNKLSGDQMRSWLIQAQKILSQPQPATTPQPATNDQPRIPSPVDPSPQPPRNRSSFTNASDIIGEEGSPQPRNLDRNLKRGTKSLDATKIDDVGGKPTGSVQDWLRAYFHDKKKPQQIANDSILNPRRISRQFISRKINEWISAHPGEIFK